MSGDFSIPAAERALRLIELLLERAEGWTPQELLLELDLSRSSLFVLLRALKTLGYVEQLGKRGRYTAGARLLAWRAPHSPTSQDLLAAFYQEAETTTPAISGAPRETLALVLPAGNGAWQVTAQVEGGPLVRSAFHTGQVYRQLPAAAQVLAAAPEAEVAANGFALHAGEPSPDAPTGPADSAEADALNLALPVCRDGRTPEAALLLSAPRFRWSVESLKAAYLEPLREMAAHLSYRLGAPFYAPYRIQPREAVQTTATLSAEEIAQFLRGPYAARLACIRPDGRPHVIPVWQEWDGRDFYVIAWRGSQWADYVQENPNVSLTVDEPWVPLRRVAVSGCISPHDAPPAELSRLLQRMTRRYLGRPAAPGMANQLQRAFRIRPDGLRGWQGLFHEEA